MSKHGKAKVKSQPPTVQPEGGDNGANETPATGFEALIATLSPELRAKAEEQLRKLVETQGRAEAAKQWVAFDKEMKEKLGEFIDGIAKTHGVDLTGRRIVITYPDGKFNYTHGAKGTATGNGGGRKDGSSFTNHGKVEQEGLAYTSLHHLATVMGWQYEGRRTAFQAVEEPQELGTKKPLGFKNSIERREDGVLVVTRNES